MNNLILAASQAKQARSELQLSQGNVVGYLGVNRTYLSQFENGRYLFDDTLLEKLRDYHEGEGYEFDEDELSSHDITDPAVDEIHSHQHLPADSRRRFSP